MIGVYCLKHEGKIVYIGSSSCNLMNRKSYHERGIKNQTHKNQYLRNLENNVVFEVLEITTRENCRARESHYLNLYKPIANKQMRANGHLTINSSAYKKAAKKRWSKLSERNKAKTSAIKRWKNTPDNLIKKNNELLRQNREKNRALYIKHCKTKLAEIKKKKVQRSDGKIFNSVNEAADYTGIKRTALSNCLNGWCKTTGGYKWKYYKN